jgi:hypothetical protein
MPKRQRTAPQPFEQGVNPPSQRATSKRRKAQPKHRAPIQSTPKRDAVLAGAASRGGLASPPATATRSLRRSPLFEPEATPAALSDGRGDSILGVDDDTEDEDPEPAAVAGEVAEAEDIGIAAAAAAAAVGYFAHLGEDDLGVDPLVHLRWRACFGDMEKNAIASACDYERNRRFGELNEVKVWQWVDRVIHDLKPRKVRVASLCVVVYSRRQAKRDRAVKTLRRGRDGEWESLRALITDLYDEASDTVHVDFDLILAEELSELPASSSAAARARPTTATMIQEHGIAGVLAAERACSGNAIGLRDCWRCDDTHCSNHLYCCWLRPGETQRFDNHYPVNANIIAMWARDIDDRKATYDEPSDRVVDAILRQKDHALRDKAQRRRAGSNGADDIKSLTKLLIVGQLAQMKQPPVVKASPILRAVEEPSTAAEELSEWAPIEYDHPMEMTEHTTNFFNALLFKYPQDNNTLHAIYERVIEKGAMYINMLMIGHDNILKLWCDHWYQPVGWLFRIFSFASQWQKSYTGLSAKSWRRVGRAIQRDRVLRQDMGGERSSSSIDEAEI